LVFTVVPRDSTYSFIVGGVRVRQGEREVRWGNGERSGEAKGSIFISAQLLCNNYGRNIFTYRVQPLPQLSVHRV
jgi:hypothetical protein